MEVAGQPALITLIIDITEGVRAARKLQELQESLREQAIHDPLTGLYNRLHLCEFLDRERALAERNGYPVALILADLTSRPSMIRMVTSPEMKYSRSSGH